MLVLGGAAAAAWLVYGKVLRPRMVSPAPTVTASPPPASATAAASEAPPSAPPELPKWMAPIEEGQQLLASGDAEGALRKFKDAADSGGGAVARSFLEQVKLGAATTGPCKLAAFSHPRLGYAGNVGRPAVAETSKGSVVAWTDDHEQPGHDHVYSVLVDAAGRATSRARDLTPEADYAMRPSLLSVGDRVALLFWDKGGREPGVKVRWLDADGRIGGMSITIGAAKPGLFWPAIDRTPDGAGFWTVWQADTDKEGDDLFLRRLDAELTPQGPEVRASDYEPEKGKSVKVSSPGIAVSGANLFIAYTLERDRQHVVERMRVPLTAPELQGASAEKPAKSVRELGEAIVVSEDKVGGDYPSVACVKDSCFLAWHEGDKGAQAALVDPTKGSVLWRKRFAPKGGHPAVGTSAEGLAQVAFYEGGRVRLASISRDGLGTTSTFAKVSGDAPRPYIAAGRARGEWLVAWLDTEAGHTEAFLARLQCKN
jgi:serine/threonine-protein kinase